MDIINEDFLCTNTFSKNDFTISIKPQINAEEFCFIIKELMIKISEFLYVDYIIKCPYNSKTNEINLQEIKLITYSNLNEKNNVSYDEIEKFDKQRNILSAYMDVKSHKISVIRSNEADKLNNSILHMKKDMSQLNIATYDNLARFKKIELPKGNNKKSKIFKKISFNNIKDDSKNVNNNNKEESNIQSYKYEEDEENTSKYNSHKIENNYVDDSNIFNYNINVKDSNLNTLGKNYNDFNANDFNRINQINNIGSDIDFLKSSKEKQISPSTEATDKSGYYTGVQNTNSKRIINDSEIGRDLNLKYI